MTNPLAISQQTARRFILGKQGLWPGRRWRGLAGTRAAARAVERDTERCVFLEAREAQGDRAYILERDAISRPRRSPRL